MKLLLSFLLVTTMMWAVSQTFQSGVTQNLLIELYSSEGCSSCPPADKWMGKFKDNKVLFKSVFPLTFHVDYWDYIGWQDPFALKKYSQRQRYYAAIGNSRQVYTPGFFMNAKEWRGWFQGESFDLSLKEVGNLIVKRENNRLNIHYNGKADEVHIALLGFNQKSIIIRGENRSRTLIHDFVVLSYDKKDFNKKASYRLPLLADKTKGYALVVWVTGDGQRIFKQVTGGYL